MTRLSPVLDARELPDAELQAMRLDGQVFPLAGSWCPLDTVETPEVRAGSIASGRSARLVAALGTAAWIWGATPRAPRLLELCADVRARARVRPGAGAVLHELVLADADVVRWPHAAATSPMRTALDLARSGAEEPEVLRRLAEVGGFDRRELIARLEAQRAPGSRRALRVLDAAFSRR